ncbi:glycosyltransferase family 2 protein [Ramlibacter sp.]|uniref:glycosyltransferase family 2 protein n=1 Tax=Ramlibacter sp. TaxID=1917967 RepID=UPI0035AFE9A3
MLGLSGDSAGQPSPKAELSVIVITRNEQANLPECLASVGFAREVVVVDCGSTDDTVALAQAAGARVVVTPDWPGFGPQKNRALDLATQPWVLSIDADERVTPALREEILAVLSTGASAADAWSMPRRSSFCGQFMAHSGWYPDRVTRLFRRGSARFSDDLVHERVVVQGRPAQLRNDLLHESFRTLESVLDKANSYSTAGARKMLAEGRRGSLGSALAHGLWAFLRTYVLRLGFLDGRLGLALAIAHAEGTYYRYLKLWLLQREGASS